MARHGSNHLSERFATSAPVGLKRRLTTVFMKLLVTGAGGMTGSEVGRQASSRGWYCAAYNRADLDVSDRSAVQDAVDSVKPDVIINAAAYTSVDAAERRPDH